jgi:hypothetical protein
MPESNLIEQRQYAETVLAGLNIRPFRVDVSKGIVYAPQGRVSVVRKLCKHFEWPFVVAPLTKDS